MLIQYSVFMLIIKKMLWVFYYYISLNLANTNENDSNLFKIFVSPWLFFLMNFLFLMGAIAVCSFSVEVFLLFTWYHYLVLEHPGLLWSPVL